MAACARCSKRLMRTHRKPLEKVLYTAVFRCSGCSCRVTRLRPFLRIDRHISFSRYTQCVRCGTVHVQRSARRDRLDTLSRSLVSRIQQLLGAPLNRCKACRLQYYDWRPPAAEGTGRGVPARD